MISAHYGLTDVFDNLVISLCKFTTLLNSMEVKLQIFLLTKGLFRFLLLEDFFI